MVENEIIIGSQRSPLFRFRNAELVSVSGEYAVDLVGNQLSIDRLNPVVRYVYHARRVLQPTDYDGLISTDKKILCGFWNDNPADTPFGTVCWHFVNGSLSRKLYIDHVERVGRDQWRIEAMSIIGILDVQPHRGGVYMGQTVAEVLTEFFGGEVGASANGFTPITGGIADCRLEDEVATTTVHGLLPYSESKRDNLHQLIFAYSINMMMDETGEIVFTYLRANEDPQIIPADRIYLGGTVAYEQPVTDVELTEYTYIYDDTAEREDVYDNTSAPHIKGEALVIFDPPINPETIETSEFTMSIRDANETSAFVRGNGIISAIPYQVQERILSRTSYTTPVRKSVSVRGVTLVNPLNSSNVMDKLFNYYTQKKTVRSSVVLDGEKPGEMYRFYNPYNELTSGIIHRMRWNTTSMTKADCEIITNFTPLGAMTNMQNVVLLTGSGTWEVPPAIKARANPFIRAAIIQGGQGGHGGYSGEESGRDPDSPGEGGLGGEGGSGGKILTVDIDVSTLNTIAYNCGKGGEGGESDEAGAYGTETRFGDYSSYNGAVVTGGILNMMNGKFYGRTGLSGIAGAIGGVAAKSLAFSPTETELASYGENGGDVEYEGKTYKGGKGGRTQSASAGGYFGWAFGSGGSGAAVGTDGNDGDNGRMIWQMLSGGWSAEGATASIPGKDATTIGTGGQGGHGGGGASAPGDSGFAGGNASTGLTALGGKGSKGGKGGDGGILIYY